MRKMLKNIMMFLAVANAIACTNNTTQKVEIAAAKKVDSIPTKMGGTTKQTTKDWVEIEANNPNFMVVMPYADTTNFTHKKIYGCPTCLLRPEVAAALITAGEKAKVLGYKIMLYDCYRPLPYQQKMFDIVPNKRYVADPKKGSVHNRGGSVDISLATLNNTPLDMGTLFDDFSEKAAYATTGLLATQANNRKALRNIMLASGFKPYNNEWWHFNFAQKEYPLSSYTWPCK